VLSGKLTLQDLDGRYALVCRVILRFDFGAMNEITKPAAWRVEAIHETGDLADHEPDEDRLQVSHHPATVVGHR